MYVRSLVEFLEHRSGSAIIIPFSTFPHTEMSVKSQWITQIPFLSYLCCLVNANFFVPMFIQSWKKTFTGPNGVPGIVLGAEDYEDEKT